MGNPALPRPFASRQWLLTAFCPRLPEGEDHQTQETLSHCPSHGIFFLSCQITKEGRSRKAHLSLTDTGLRYATITSRRKAVILLSGDVFLSLQSMKWLLLHGLPAIKSYRYQFIKVQQLMELLLATAWLAQCWPLGPGGTCWGQDLGHQRHMHLGKEGQGNVSSFPEA